MSAVQGSPRLLISVVGSVYCFISDTLYIRAIESKCDCETVSHQLKCRYCDFKAQALFEPTELYDHN